MLRRALAGSVGAAAAGLYHVSSFPRFPAVVPKVGNVKVRLAGCGDSKTVFAQIFYPATDAKNSGSASNLYMRDASIDGLCAYIGSSVLSLLLTGVTHPCGEGMAAPSTTLPSSLPIVLFSHGLAGSAEMYTVLCANMAASGAVVVALECEDGSASYSTNGSVALPYIRAPSDLNYSNREEVVAFRRPFLDKRYEELTTMLRTIQSAQQTPAALSKSSGSLEESVALEVLKHADLQRTVLVGHSFGAASTVQTMERLAKDKRAAAGAKVVGVCAMDLWSYPLPQHTLENRIQAPSLFITSAQFESNDEFGFTEKLISSCGEQASLVAVHGSRHQFVSDTPFFFPKPISDAFQITGRDETASTTSAAVADLLSSFIAHCADPASNGRESAHSDELWKKKLDKLTQDHENVLLSRGSPP